jgi:opacity protein-like surface antigen
MGLGGGAGIEWYVPPNISLSAEYRFQFARESTEVTQGSEDLNTGQTDRSEQETPTYRFGGWSVLVGITFSFGP